MGGLVELTWAGIRTDTETDFVTLEKAGLDDVWVVNTFNVPERDTGFEKGCTKRRRGQAKNVADCSIITGGESFAVRPSRLPHFFHQSSGFLVNSAASWTLYQFLSPSVPVVW